MRFVVCIDYPTISVVTFVAVVEFPGQIGNLTFSVEQDASHFQKHIIQLRWEKPQGIYMYYKSSICIKTLTVL